MPTRILRLPEVLNRVPLSRSTVYLLISQGKFPQPVSLTGGRSRGYREADIEAWLASREEGVGAPVPRPDRAAQEAGTQ